MDWSLESTPTPREISTDFALLWRPKWPILGHLPTAGTARDFVGVWSLTAHGSIDGAIDTVDADFKQAVENIEQSTDALPVACLS